MAITAQRLLTELGNRAWSGFNKDDMIWGSEDAEQAKAELNSALRYLINLEDFPFRAKNKVITTSEGMATYSYPQGIVTNIVNTDSLTPLTFIGDSTKYDVDATGTPESFWVEYKNPTRKIRLYPIPDNVYNLKVVYNVFMPVMTVNNTPQMEFTSADDTLNLTGDLEFLFMDCLVLRTMIQNNKDEQDENYRPTISEFNEYWRIFKKACKPAQTETRIIW